MTRTPIVLNGQKVGRLRASFILLKETLRFFWADKEMLWVPIITSIMQLLLIGLMVVTVIIPSGILNESEANSTLTALEYGYIFVFYIIGAFTVAFAQATITHIVYTRIHGGDATLGSGLHVAASHTGTLLFWAGITSTVGLVLRAVAERSQILVRILVFFLGAMWSVLTYFVVPAIIIDKKDVFQAVRHSGATFKHTWGETLVTNISFSFVFTVTFLLLTVVLIGLMFVLGGDPVVVIVCSIIFCLAILGMVVLSSVLSSVLRTILYVYANEGTVPANFNRELLEHMLVRTTVSTPAVQINTVV